MSRRLAQTSRRRQVHTKAHPQVKQTKSYLRCRDPVITEHVSPGLETREPREPFRTYNSDNSAIVLDIVCADLRDEGGREEECEEANKEQAEAPVCAAPRSSHLSRIAFSPLECGVGLARTGLGRRLGRFLAREEEKGQRKLNGDLTLPESSSTGSAHEGKYK